MFANWLQELIGINGTDNVNDETLCLHKLTKPKLRHKYLMFSRYYDPRIGRFIYTDNPALVYLEEMQGKYKVTSSFEVTQIKNLANYNEELERSRFKNGTV